MLKNAHTLDNATAINGKLFTTVGVSCRNFMNFKNKNIMEEKTFDEIMYKAIKFIVKMSNDTVSEEDGKQVIKELEQIKFCNLHFVTNRALKLKVQKLEADNKLLNFMVENGLGEDDMMNDITYPCEI